MLDQNDSAFNLSTPYRAVALYLKESDSIEYTRVDVPCIHRRIDDFLTLVLDIKSRELIGFRFKGFRHYYLNEIKTVPSRSDKDFSAAVFILERMMTQFCDDRFQERIEAYRMARDIALQDRVELSDLPDAA